MTYLISNRVMAVSVFLFAIFGASAAHQRDVLSIAGWLLAAVLLIILTMTRWVVADAVYFSDFPKGQERTITLPELGMIMGAALLFLVFLLKALVAKEGATLFPFFAAHGCVSIFASLSVLMGVAAVESQFKGNDEEVQRYLRMNKRFWFRVTPAMCSVFYEGQPKSEVSIQGDNAPKS